MILREVSKENENNTEAKGFLVSANIENQNETDGTTNLTYSGPTF